MSAGRAPLTALVIAGVLAVHLAAFWWLADKHFLPKTTRVPLRPPANFAAGSRVLAVDPQTGQHVTETDYVVSTRLQPSPSPAKAR